MDSDHNDIVWQGKSWRLRLSNQTLPDGSQVELAYIDHPGSVVIVPLVNADPASEVLMVRQYRHSLDETIIELPAGTRGWEEDLHRCAQRELREETGYRADKFVELGHYWPAPGLSSEVMNLYLATGLSYDPLPQDADEVIEPVSIALDELLGMALDGRLRDAKSVVGIVRTAAHLRLPPFNNEVGYTRSTQQ